MVQTTLSQIRHGVEDGWGLSPIIRNAELILWAALANIGAGDEASAVPGISVVRTDDG
jgi:hypothetical protein